MISVPYERQNYDLFYGGIYITMWWEYMYLQLSPAACGFAGTRRRIRWVLGCSQPGPLPRHAGLCRVSTGFPVAPAQPEPGPTCLIATQTYLHALPASAVRFREECNRKGIILSEAQSIYLDALQNDAVGSCRETAKACWSSGIRQEGFMRNLIEGNEEGCFKLNGKCVTLPLIQPILDCPTRWASTGDMIDNFCLLYIAIIDYSLCNSDLNIPCLSHKQFSVLQDISVVLTVPCCVQQLLSAEHTPTLALALPLYENLIKIWKTCLAKFPEQQHAISLGINKIEEYITKSCKSSVYAFAMFVNPHIKMDWINKNWNVLPGETATASPAEHVLDAVKAQLLVYAEEQHQMKLAQCCQIQSSRVSRANRAAMSQQHRYTELLLLSKTIERAPDHPLNSLFINSTEGSSSLFDVDWSNIASPMQSPGPFHSDQHNRSVSSEPQPLSYASLVAQLTPEQLRARHLANVETEVAIWLGTGTLRLEVDPTNPMTKKSVNIVDYWKAR
ncbi:hypothetical protein RSOLAG22IIIB_10342 [Rhizoctonia solani]|uniref:Uncharacterized protein n=1 Tax=Rhizoctonia solani TaxID=456999 RepID=A0A0K6G2X2_9AGAM|nr:hypothetical protein RSOLAG22IIIB_10342 [Rhizoctonia solani]